MDLQRSGHTNFTGLELLCLVEFFEWQEINMNVQVFALTQSSLNDTYFTTINATTATAHLPGLRLRVGIYNFLAVILIARQRCIIPFQLGARKDATGEEFGWDCEPLIPISVWASVLVGFGLQYFATTYKLFTDHHLPGINPAVGCLHVSLPEHTHQV